MDREKEEKGVIYKTQYLGRLDNWLDREAKEKVSYLSGFYKLRRLDE